MFFLLKKYQLVYSDSIKFSIYINMKYLFYLLGFISLISCGQKEQYHLLTVEVDTKEPYLTIICQYTMVDTGFVKAIIYKGQKSEDFYRYSSPLHHTIINNQYIIDKDGSNIFDLEVGSFVFVNDNHGYFVELTDKQVIYTRKSNYFDDIPVFRVSGYDTLPPHKFSDNYNSDFIAFDFELGKIIELDSLSALEYSNKGIYSTDKSKRIFSYYDSTRSLNTYKYYDTTSICMWSRNFFVDNRLSILDNANQEIMNVSIGYVSNIWYNPKEPVLWIDNNRFITQQENNQLILVNTENKNVSKFPKIKDVELCRLSKFETDFQGSHYFVVNNMWKIDAENLQLKKVDKIPFSNHLEKLFSINEGRDSRDIGDINYLYKGNSILNDSTQTEKYDLIDNYLAIQCGGDVNSNFQTDVEFKVFNTETKELKTLKIKRMNGWIGWVKR